MILVLFNTVEQFNELCHHATSMHQGDLDSRIERKGQYAVSCYDDGKYHGYCWLLYYTSSPVYKGSEIMCYKEYKRRFK